MSVLERHAMEEANVKMVSMTTLANVILDSLAKTAKQVSKNSSQAVCLSSMLASMITYFAACFASRSHVCYPLWCNCKYACIM